MRRLFEDRKKCLFRLAQKSNKHMMTNDPSMISKRDKKACRCCSGVKSESSVSSKANPSRLFSRTGRSGWRCSAGGGDGCKHGAWTSGCDRQCRHLNHTAINPHLTHVPYVS
eukprot:353304-Chlamydomonas_euryale.AAC.4